MAKKIHRICAECGSDTVSRDATAWWNAAEQEWQLDGLNDYEFCSDCESEAGTIEATEDEYPPEGTTVAVLVGHISDYCSAFHIVDTAGTKYFIYDEKNQNPFSSWRTDQAEQHKNWKGVVQVGDLVVLRKSSTWRWEIVKEHAEAATGK